MREIKFRGKTNTGCWVYGSLVYSKNIKPAIYYEIGSGLVNDLVWYYVKPESIGQYTGLKDKNGKEIYEGDILQEQEGMKGKFVVVPMLGGLSIYCLRNYGQKHNELIAFPTNDAQTAAWIEQQEIIGNITENPEIKDK